MKWFRFYNDVMHDPKVQKLRPPLFKFWINLLCLSSSQKTRGTLPDVEEIAYILRLKTTTVRGYVDELLESRLLDRLSRDSSVNGHAQACDAFVIHNWIARQPESDDVSERVRRHRQKSSDKPPLQPDRECNVSGNVSGNDTVTVQIQKEIKSKKECVIETEASGAIQTSNTHALLSSSPQRTEADLADIRRAEVILAENLQTHHLAMDLSRNHGINGMQAIPGWKFLYAARRVTSGDVGQDKFRWPYFLGIARNATEAERDAPAKPAKREKPAEPQPPYLQEAPWRELGYYKFKGWPVPREHPDYPEYAAEMARKASGVAQEASSAAQPGRESSEAKTGL